VKSVTVLLPCLNESETIVVCIDKPRKSLTQLNVSGEVPVADNGSREPCLELASETLL
jgi:glycosyltransferase involved in cell wall biosynthesis